MKYKVGRAWAATIYLKKTLKKPQNLSGFISLHKEEKEKECGPCFFL